MLILVARNTSSQDVAVNGLVNLGSVYRKYCKSCDGVRTFEFTSNAIALQFQGIYKVQAEITFTGDTAGVATFSLTENNEVIPSATASETITTVDTEVRSVTLLGYVLVDNACILNKVSTLIKNISVINTGVAVNISNIVVSIEKVV